MPDTDTYLTNECYQALVTALLRASDHRHDHASSVKEALGEVGGIWPEKVRDHAEISA